MQRRARARFPADLRGRAVPVGPTGAPSAPCSPSSAHARWGIGRRRGGRSGALGIQRPIRSAWVRQLSTAQPRAAAASAGSAFGAATRPGATRRMRPLRRAWPRTYLEKPAATRSAVRFTPPRWEMKAVMSMPECCAGGPRRLLHSSVCRRSRLQTRAEACCERRTERGRPSRAFGDPQGFGALP